PCLSAGDGQSRCHSRHDNSLCYFIAVLPSHRFLLCLSRFCEKLLCRQSSCCETGAFLLRVSPEQHQSPALIRVPAMPAASHRMLLASFGEVLECRRLNPTS